MAGYARSDALVETMPQSGQVSDLLVRFQQFRVRVKGNGEIRELIDEGRASPVVKR